MNKIDRPPGYSKWPREDQDAWYRANVLRLPEGKVMDWNPGGNGATWDEPDMSDHYSAPRRSGVWRHPAGQVRPVDGARTMGCSLEFCGFGRTRIPFRLGTHAPRAEWTISALDRLRELELAPGDPPAPIPIPLTDEARKKIELWWGDAAASSERRRVAALRDRQSPRTSLEAGAGA